MIALSDYTVLSLGSMNLPTLLPLLVNSDLTALPPFVDRTYGEPLFFTDSEVVALQYAPDDTLWSIEDSGVLRQWGTDGRLLFRSFLSDLETLWCFSRDAVLIAAGSDEIVLWETATGQALRRVDCGSWATTLLFSPDGSTLASGHDDGTVRLWNARTLEPLGQFDGHGKEISALCFRFDGLMLASASEDRTIRVWDVPAKRCLYALSGHTDRIPSLAWHPNGELLVSAGWDTTARVWQPPASEPLMLLNSHSEQVHGVLFSPDGRLLAVSDSDFTIHLWTDPKSGRTERVLTGHDDEIRCLSFSLDGKRLASAGADHVVHIWDTQSGQLVAGPNPQARHWIGLGLSEKGEVELFSNAGSAIQAWDADSGKISWSPRHEATVNSLATSPDGKYLATSGPSHEAHLWDAASKKLLATLPHTRGPIADLTFSADSKFLATASFSDGLIWLWKIGEPEAVLVIPEAAESSTLETIAYHPEGKLLAVGGLDYLSTGGSDGATCIWNLEERDKLLSLDVGVSSLAFDPKGTLLAAGTLKQTVVIWDIANEKKLFELAGHQDRIGGLTFSPDGSYLVSGSDDGTLRVWNVLTGKLLVARQFETAVQSIRYSLDGQYLFTGNGNFTAYRLESKRLLED
jgi:WD40 repeat protein